MLAGLHQSSSGSTSSVFPLPSWLSQFSSSSPPAPASVRGQLLIPSHTLLLGSLVVPSLQQKKSSSSPSTRASLFGSSLLGSSLLGSSSSFVDFVATEAITAIAIATKITTQTKIIPTTFFPILEFSCRSESSNKSL